MLRNIIIALVSALSLWLLAGQAMAADARGIPDGATGFAGMVSGDVATVGAGEVMLKVTEVTKSWQHSKAANPQSLVGQQIRVVAGKNKNIARYIATLKAGDHIVADVKADGDVLVWLELTAEQREKVK